MGSEGTFELVGAVPTDSLPVDKSARGVSVQAGAVLMYDENRRELLGVFGRLRERCLKLLPRRENARPEGRGPYVVLRVVTELDVELRLPPETAVRLPRTITQARMIRIPRDLAVEQGGVLVEETLVALLGRTRGQIAAVGGVKILEAKTRHEVAHLLHD